MIALFALLLGLQAAPPVSATLPPVPTDLSKVAPLPWRAAPRITPELARFVADEVKARHCAAVADAGTQHVVDVDLAVAVRPDGTVRAVVPRAIDCPAVEQYAAGLVTSMARSNLRDTPEGWYRTTLSFAWSK